MNTPGTFRERTGEPKRIAVLASGRGSNLQAILDATRSGEVNGRVALVISDHSKCYALERAKRAGVPAIFVSAKEAGSRLAFDERVSSLIDEYGAEIVCLAGFMRIFTPWFVRRYFGRMLNIHPALLPSFPGLCAQRQALEHGVKVSGCTVHFADEGTDTGPIIVQAAVPVEEDDTEDSLSERILIQEHLMYVKALKFLCEGKLEISGNKVIVRGE